MHANQPKKLDQFRENLKSNQWQDIQKETFADTTFELTAWKKIGLVKQRLLVQYFSNLDEKCLSDMVKTFNEIDAKPTKVVGTHTFVLCILAEKISEGALDLMATFPFKQFSQTASKGGKGIALIIHLELKELYGKCPSMPIPVKKICRNLLESLTATFQLSSPKGSPKPEVTFNQMKADQKKWGFGLIGLGILHLILRSLLDPTWGLILMVIGAINIFKPNRLLYIVNGSAIIVAAIFNLVALANADIKAGIFIIIFQIIWGINEIKKYKQYG